MLPKSLIVVALFFAHHATSQCDFDNFRTCRVNHSQLNRAIQATFNAALSPALPDWSDASLVFSTFLQQFTTKSTTDQLSQTCRLFASFVQCAAKAQPAPLPPSTFAGCTSLPGLSILNVTGQDRFRIKGALDLFDYLCTGAGTSSTHTPSSFHLPSDLPDVDLVSRSDLCAAVVPHHRFPGQHDRPGAECLRRAD